MFKTNGLNEIVISEFQKIIYDYYKQYGRKFPFRMKISPYYVLISEIMLQQTQTSRVSKRFLDFIKAFPDFQSLANASINDVLKKWQGLGYNRRALALKEIAKRIVNDFQGVLPETVDILKTFPQIGLNTASSIITFAFNKPSYFIETNIRRVYIYFFFFGKDNIDDRDILKILKKTIDLHNPRKWYYALMDYGVMLKKNHPELHKKSKHYKKQSSFKGSNRQLRGLLIKLLLEKKSITQEELIKELNIPKNKLINIINQLEKEGFLKKEEKEISIIK